MNIRHTLGFINRAYTISKAWLWALQYALCLYVYIVYTTNLLRSSILFFPNHLKRFYLTHDWGRYHTNYRHETSPLGKTGVEFTGSHIVTHETTASGSPSGTPYNIQHFQGVAFTRKDKPTVLCYFPIHLPLAPYRTKWKCFQSAA